MKTLLALVLIAALAVGAVFLTKRHRAQPATAAPLSPVAQTALVAPNASRTVSTEVSAIPPPTRQAPQVDASAPVTTAVATPAVASAPNYLRRLLNGELPQPGKNVGTVAANGSALFQSQPNLLRLLQEQPTAK